jgi:predicted DNA-binding protein with PD1-like motif
MNWKRQSIAYACLLGLLLFTGADSSRAQSAESLISPSRPVPAGKAPGMEVKRIKNAPDEQVYAVIFHKGDEALSGLTDFATQYKVGDAHFTAIGASSGALLALLEVDKKMYRPIPVRQQVEVLSLIGEIATYNGKPVVHMHAVLGKPDGSTIGGHVFELNVNPTLEVFVTADTTPLNKKPDEASGMKLIDPTQ